MITIMGKNRIAQSQSSWARRGEGVSLFAQIRLSIWTEQIGINLANRIKAK